ncbi:hypothetical protein MRX96_005027 [Rhipicephalus microplus]
MLVLENALPTALARAGFFPLALDGTRARARWWRHRAPSWKTNQDGGAHGRTRLTSAVRESTGEKVPSTFQSTNNVLPVNHRGALSFRKDATLRRCGIGSESRSVVLHIHFRSEDHRQLTALQDDEEVTVEHNKIVRSEFTHTVVDFSDAATLCLVIQRKKRTRAPRDSLCRCWDSSVYASKR